MKLLFYTDASALGGAERVLGHLLADLDRSIDVVVVGIEPTVVAAVARRRPGCEREVLAPVEGKWNLSRIRAHIRTIRRHQPDVVHVHLQTPWVGQYGILAGIICRRPVVAVQQIVFPTRSPLQRLLRRLLHRHLAAHVAVGDQAARELEAMLRLDHGAIEVIHNGVPDREPDPVALPVGSPVIGSLARLDPQKGIDTLLQALSLMPAEVNCVIVGDGPERERLEALAAELELDGRVLVTGWTARARDYLPSFDVFVLPSRFEAFPLAIIEAMMARRPVVATPVQSVPEAVVDGDTGLLVPVDDPAALAGAVKRLLTDPDLRSKMGERARERALAHFTADRMTRRFEAVYTRVARG